MNIRRSLRIIFRNKIYSFLNILGLAIGITSAALIFLWVESKVNFNKAIPNSRNIYVSASHYFPVSNECITSFESNSMLSKVLEDEFPEVKSCSRYSAQPVVLSLKIQQTLLKKRELMPIPLSFNLIGMKFISGDASSVFEPQYSIVLSRSMARKIYNEEDPIGKGLIHEGVIYQVTGVFEDMPGNTSFQFEWLIPFRVFVEEMKKVFNVNEWGASWLQTYVELEPGVDLEQLNEEAERTRFS